MGFTAELAALKLSLVKMLGETESVFAIKGEGKAVIATFKLAYLVKPFIMAVIVTSLGFLAKVIILDP